MLYPLIITTVQSKTSPRHCGRRAALSLVLLAFLSPASLADTGRELLDQAKSVNDAREPKDQSQRVRMTLIDARGSARVRELAVYSKTYGRRNRKSISFFLSPPEVKGVGFLAWSYPDKDTEQWLYLPELKRVRQIGADNRHQSFQGSDFTYGDLRLFDDIRDWTEKDAASELRRADETVDGVQCAVIELDPRRHDSAYSRLVIWLDRSDYVFHKIDFYDVGDGALTKTMSLGNIATIDGIPTAQRIEMANVRKGTRTVMEISAVHYNQGLSDDLFRERSLERPRID